MVRSYTQLEVSINIVHFSVYTLVEEFKWFTLVSGILTKAMLESNLCAWQMLLLLIFSVPIDVFHFMDIFHSQSV